MKSLNYHLKCEELQDLSLIILLKDMVVFIMSRGSLYELLDQVITAQDEEYIDNDLYDELRLMIMECIKILNGFINYLESAKTK